MSKFDLLLENARLAAPSLFSKKEHFFCRIYLLCPLLSLKLKDIDFLVEKRANHQPQMPTSFANHLWFTSIDWSYPPSPASISLETHFWPAKHLIGNDFKKTKAVWSKRELQTKGWFKRKSPTCTLFWEARNKSILCSWIFRLIYALQAWDSCDFKKSKNKPSKPLFISR